ncbi:radical SAM family heme chaperone HemW [Proteiniborus sp. MB09-C3]|uniref:radical SAM family heme chaperone HemW n=1 Tax=Proteiniborus sp. MB09-C3 TaxID=3050072 RepID=UPI002552E2FF|nr:radical SAM family heme chaperone HemW [Proteiniborus sp. MB09-C3]WIV10680.1 radical SAM family heme chaperone HemW [Proteiniborus sp. MB09-C3]
MKDIGIYIHIPFCKSKCYYCDFCSFPRMLDSAEKYVSYIKKEIDLYEEDLKEYNVNTIFLGGGTPTVIDGKYIYEIIDYIYKKTNANQVKEITIEANPKTLDEEKLEMYKKAGINRISIGVQSMNDMMLKKIGRIHTVEDFTNTYNLIRKYEFNNVSFDIMFNLPEQTLEDSIRTLKLAIQLEPEHISYYSLKIEEGTPFNNKYINKQLILPDEDVEREMYHEGIELLKKKGYHHYEISNFAKKGYESKHNLIYWKCEPYIGLGLSAHSYFKNYRYGNTEDMNIYFEQISNKNLATVEKELIDKDMEIAEYLILGLRLIEGVNSNKFKEKFNINIKDIYGKTINKFINEGLLEEDRDNIRLTKGGLDLSNIVFMEILP